MAAELQPGLLTSCQFTTTAFQLLSSQQKTHEHQLSSRDALRFSLVQSKRREAAPFASISSGRQQGPTWQPRFTLSRLADSGSSSDVGSSDTISKRIRPSRAGSSGTSTGFESSSDDSTPDSTSTELNLDKISCQLCRRSLSQPGGGTRRTGLFGRRSRQGSPSSGRTHSSSSSSSSSRDFLVCDCCQRCYHEVCCAEQGMSTREQAGGVWYHSPACKECQRRLQEQVALGRCPLPEGRSWQLVDCAPVSPSGQGGLRALQTLKRNLGEVLEVLLPQYGPAVAQQLVDTTKGYAVLLRHQSTPVTAGLLDVYGKDVAVLDVVATVLQEQGQGHCTALLGALEGWLGPRLGVDSLLAVCPQYEQHTLSMWQQKFGFQRIGPKQLRQLQSALPALSYYEDSVLLSKTLTAKQHKGQPAQHKQAAAETTQQQQRSSGSRPGQSAGP